MKRIIFTKESLWFTLLLKMSDFYAYVYSAFECLFVKTHGKMYSVKVSISFKKSGHIELFENL